MSFPMVVLYFSTYHEAKQLFGYHEIDNPNPVLPILSGAISRLIAVTVVSPIEMIRTKMQSEKLKYSEISQAVRYSTKNYGLKSLYRGLVPTIWRDVPFSMIYWFNYEKLKTSLLNYKTQRISLNSYETFVCGALAGSVAATITCPLDVVKTYR
jgi:solute carrier family 25 protein 39/40